ncbi:concanavalin A-like lectin/glucanase [Gymnopus androsaceus JB14]|uniref:Glucanase n=1 Tax=Gymnopus androsaceus JB14 TaxID=1447944 RepID=A0A6A4HEU7_9AGAR|nr:concanavalin A-like lectin/glucanase [Gymnopus androsaceus JB14]
MNWNVVFIKQVADVYDVWIGWAPASNNGNTGTGDAGSCCAEMDIWEANSISAAVTPHSCTVTQQTSCSASGATCSSANSTAGACDQAGQCDFNSYRLGDTSFYGPGLTVDNQTTGTLMGIRRLYVQNGVVIQNSMTNIPGITATNEITTAFCQQQKTAFGDTDTFDQKGGLAAMGNAFADGMVLVLSLWDDYAVNMLWLDSDYPTTGTAPGDKRGTCATSSGVPKTVEAQSPNAQVIYSNIRVGPLGSTTGSQPGGTPSGTPSGTPTDTPTGSAPGATQSVYGQW